MSNYNKSILGIVTIIVVIILLVILLVPSTDNDIDKTKIYTGSGPRINLQSITSGNTLAVPELGHTAIYGFYSDDERIGEITYSTEKEEVYEGTVCYKITGTGDMSGGFTGLKYEFVSYIAKSDNSLVFSRYTYFSGDIETNYTARSDRDTGKLITEVGGIEVVYTMPDSFWEVSDLHNDLDLDYEKQITMKSETGGPEIEILINITVSKIEDVNTPIGRFQDCYKLDLLIKQQIVTTTTSVWINDQGITPKMEIYPTPGTLEGAITTILEEYN
jgi:hypothetical protein